ncbi:MAG: transcription elongation factor GreA [Parcubacteria group bacterium]|nr:transcription elongation factor GreA [Parcubacteria group bacterium]
MIKNYLSPEAYKKLKEELNFLKTTKRQEVALKIQEAKELGDLSENAAYQEAKDTQAALETRILELELLLKNAVLIHPKKGNGFVELGSTIVVQSLTLPKIKRQFTIIGAHETDPNEGKISNESPLGKSFLGHKKGEVVIVKTPKGDVKYKIVEIK